MKIKGSHPHDFAKSPQANTQRSVFDRSHGHKTTFDASYLIPVYLDEALPGDTFNLHMTAFARMSTPMFPIMDNLYMDSFFFAVPWRLVWDNWEKFNGAQDDPEDSTDYILPSITVSKATDITEGSLSDYFGIPTKRYGVSFHSGFHRSYYLIWNEWFRDQNIQDSLNIPTGDGPDSITDFVLLRRNKRHDYFTSCLPWPQKGPAVPILDEPRVFGRGMLDYRVARQYEKDGLDLFDSKNLELSDLHEFSTVSPQSPTFANATVNTINTLRQAFQVQKMFERDARGGSRYIEIIKSHFGVVSPDARLQRPEYLGGSSSMININPVAQTSAEIVSKDAGIDTTPQGTLSAFATTTHHCSFAKSFTEHCMIIGMVSVRADLTYQDCINRMFTRSTRFDFYWPALAHLGEQAVMWPEINGQAWRDKETCEVVFGYQERYAEYRYKPSQITGLFRSNATGSLDAWHLAQDLYGWDPQLNSEFIQEDVPMDRILSVPTEPHFIFDSHFSLKCARPMPTYSIPGLVDHF